MPINLGFVGLSNHGWASMALVAPLLCKPLSERYSITAISTTSVSSAAMTAEKYSNLTSVTVKAYHGDTSAISSDPNIDMVAVAVKAPSHKEAAMPIIEAGKDLFLEWPAGKNLSDTVELAEAAKRKGIRTIVGTQGRQSPVLRKLKEMIASGQIGKVMSTTVTGRPFRELFAWGPYLAERSLYIADVQNGASMLDISVGHFLDGFTFALGDFASVVAILENQYPEAQVVDATGKPTGKTIRQTGAQQAAISGLLKNGAVVSIHWRGGLETRTGKGGTPFIWTVDGAQGSIRLENDEAGGSSIHIREPQLYLNGEQIQVEADSGLGNLGRNWLEFSKGSEGSYATLEDAVKTRRVLHAIAESAEKGERIDLERMHNS